MVAAQKGRPDEQEFPTVQMPSLDLPSRPPGDGADLDELVRDASSARIPAAPRVPTFPEVPVKGSEPRPEEDDFDVAETHRIDPAEPIDRRRGAR